MTSLLNLDLLYGTKYPYMFDEFFQALLYIGIQYLSNFIKFYSMSTLQTLQRRIIAYKTRIVTSSMVRSLQMQPHSCNRSGKIKVIGPAFIMGDGNP